MEKLLENLMKQGSDVAPKIEKVREAYCGSQGDCQRC